MNSTKVVHTNSTKVVHKNTTKVVHTNTTKVVHTNTTTVVHTNSRCGSGHKQYTLTEVCNCASKQSTYIHKQQCTTYIGCYLFETSPEYAGWP